MAKPEALENASLPVGREALSEVRLQAGGVHWQGARLVTHVTTDEAKKSVFGSHVLVVEGIWLHPAGVLIKLEGQKYVVPHARVEVYTLA